MAPGACCVHNRCLMCLCSKCILCVRIKCLLYVLNRCLLCVPTLMFYFCAVGCSHIYYRFSLCMCCILLPCVFCCYQHSGISVGMCPLVGGLGALFLDLHFLTMWTGYSSPGQQPAVSLELSIPGFQCLSASIVG